MLEIKLYWLEAVLLIVWTVGSPCHPFHIDSNHASIAALVPYVPKRHAYKAIIEFSWPLFLPWRIRVVLNPRIMEEAINIQLEETLASNCCVRTYVSLSFKEGSSRSPILKNPHETSTYIHLKIWLGPHIYIWIYPSYVPSQFLKKFMSINYILICFCPSRQFQVKAHTMKLGTFM